MSGMILKVKVWTKGLLVAFVAVYTLTFLVKNSARERVWLWYFVEPFEIGLPLLIVGSFLAGVVVTLLVRTLVNTIRQFREIKAQSRQVQMERDLADMKAKAGMLQTKDGA